MRATYIIVIVITIIFAGCSTNSGVVPLGPDSYMISRQGSGFWVMPATLKTEALGEANEYCSRTKKRAVLVRSELLPQIPLNMPGGPRFPTAEIQFTCVTPGSGEVAESHPQTNLNLSNLETAVEPSSAAITTSVSAAKNAEARTALLIGNANYPQSPLKTPREDIRAVRGTLNGLGFDVISVEDARRKDFISAIEQFNQKIQNKGGVGLVFYAGHGMQINGKNFLIPVDATIQSEISGSSEAVDVDLLLDSMAQSGTRINIIILDACRNNPFERRFRGSGRGLAPMNAGDAKGMLIAYSTAPGKTASDGEGQHSPYAQALTQALKVPGLTIEQVFKQVRLHVEQDTAGSQIPWETSSLTGELILN